MNCKNLWAGYFVFSLIFRTHSSVNLECVYQRLPLTEFICRGIKIQNEYCIEIWYSDESIQRYINLNFLSGEQPPSFQCSTNIDMSFNVQHTTLATYRISVHRHTHESKSKTNVKMGHRKTIAHIRIGR